MALPRRTFLRGMGVTLGLPLLDAMVPAASVLANTAAKPVRRLGFVYIPNGAVMSQWQPEDDGALKTLSQTLSPLERPLSRATTLTPHYPFLCLLDEGGKRTHWRSTGEHIAIELELSSGNDRLPLLHSFGLSALSWHDQSDFRQRPGLPRIFCRTFDA